MYVLSLVLVFMFIQMFMFVIVVVITVMMAFFILIGINYVGRFLYSRHIQMQGIYLLLMLLTVRMRALLSKAMRVPTGSAMQDEIHTNIY